MSGVVAGIPVARGLQGKLSNEEVHDLFQNVGSGAVQPCSVYALLDSRGSTGCKQGVGQDGRMVQCLMQSRCSVHDVISNLVLSDPSAQQRVAHARSASVILDKTKCRQIGRGHVWRFVLHAKCKMDNSIAKHRSSWLTCICREVGDGGLSVDGDVARAVYEHLGLEWRKQATVQAPRQESWLKRHAEHVESALHAIERNRKKRRLQASWYLLSFRSEWHETFDNRQDLDQDSVSSVSDQDQDSDRDAEELSAICDSDQDSSHDWGDESLSGDSEPSSDWYRGDEESGEGCLA